MAESEPGAVATATREGKYFDTVVEEQGDFNPFADRGWMTLRRQFEQRILGNSTSKQPRMLEIGCGTGQSLQIYKGLISFHVGIDLSEVALRIASANFPDSNWMRTDGCRLPVADATFDVVAFSSVLHHIPDYTLALKEAMRVLRPGGMVFAFDPNLLHPAMMMLRWPKSPLYLAAGVSPNERPLLASALRRAFERAGFEHITARGQANIAYRHVAPKLVNALLSVYNAADWMMDFSGLGRWFGTFVVTTARKPGGAF